MGAPNRCVWGELLGRGTQTGPRKGKGTKPEPRKPLLEVHYGGLFSESRSFRVNSLPCPTRSSSAGQSSFPVLIFRVPVAWESVPSENT